MTIGDKIRLHRKALGLTQTELGDRLGVKTNAVSKWECGRVEDIPTSKIKAMAALFDVRPSYLIDEGPAETQDPQLKILADALDQLNDEGREKLLDYAADLVASGRYIKTDSADVVHKRA